MALWLLGQTPADSPDDHPAWTRDMPPLSAWSEQQLKEAPYAGYLLEALLAEVGVRTDDFRTQLFSLVIGLSNAIGDEEEPHRALALAAGFFGRDLGFNPCAGPAGSLEAVLPQTVLEKRCGTPIVLATLLLAILDRQAAPGEAASRFPLTPVLLPGALVLRYEHKDYHLTVIPAYGEVIASDRELLARWPVTPEQQEHGVYFRAINRPELAGLLLGELARAYGVSGNEALEERYLRGAVSLFPASPDLRLDLARLLLRAGQHAEAMPHIGEALRSDTQRGEGHFLRGVALLAQDAKEEARKALLAALELNHTEGGKVWLYLARIAALERSIPELKRCLETFKERSGRKDLEAEIEAALREIRVKEAIEVLRSGATYEKRFAAIKLLQRFPTQAGNEALIACLEDPNLRFRAVAWQALSSIAGVKLPLDSREWHGWLASQAEAQGTRLWSNLDILPARSNP